MTADVVPLGNEKHAAAELLLPWYVNGTLAPAEAAGFEAHLQDCAACRAEVAWQQRLSAVPPLEGAGSDADAGWAALHAQLQRPAAPSTATTSSAEFAARSGPAGRGRSRPAPAPYGSRWFPWVLALQFIGMVAVGAALFFSPVSQAPYTTLGTPAGPMLANVLVVFKPTATEAQMRSALRAANGRFVGGPTVTGAYLVAVPPDALAGAVVRLRSDAAVIDVESLDARPAP